MYTVILYSILVQPHSIKPLQDIDDVWTASELATSAGKFVPTGSVELDAQLPGGGWPVGVLVEILQIPGTQCEWRLLLPGLAQTQGVLVLVGAAHAPFAAALAGQGLNPQRLLCIHTELPAHSLWATEQALRCKDVGAVLAWLPLARAEQLRRLQMAATEHAKLLFVVRPISVQSESSPAALRLMASNALRGDALLVNILKRRGPPLAYSLTLPMPARLAALMALTAVTAVTAVTALKGLAGSDGVSSRPVQASNDAWMPDPWASDTLKSNHALDRTATATA